MRAVWDYVLGVVLLVGGVLVLGSGGNVIGALIGLAGVVMGGLLIVGRILTSRRG